MLEFTAHSDGKVIVPDEPVRLPSGQAFRVVVDLPDEGEAQGPGWLEKAIEISRQMPESLPEDLAEQHDHYIHGSPKR